MYITLDHNLLIDLESDGATPSQTLKRLVFLHDSGQITIRVSAIGASERLKGKTYAPDFSAFQERVCKLSQKKFEILKPLGYWDITYWDWCIYGGEGTPENELEQKIHAVLFPETEFEWQRYAQAHGLDSNQEVEKSREYQNWRNRKCDVLTMWCHIYYVGDVFVTRDKHFFGTKKAALVNLGAKNILCPAEAISLIARNRSGNAVEWKTRAHG
jgi:hypothetical protein